MAFGAFWFEKLTFPTSDFDIKGMVENVIQIQRKIGLREKSRVIVMDTQALVKAPLFIP